MSFILATLLMAAPVVSTEEVNCITNGLFDQAKAGDAFDPGPPTAACKTKYGWTDEETEMAVAVAKAMSIALDDRQQAIEKGADPQLLDEVFDSFSDAEITKFGYFGEHQQGDALTQNNLMRFELATRTIKRIPAAASNIMIQIAIIDRAILKNTVRAFSDLRAKRD